MEPSSSHSSWNTDLPGDDLILFAPTYVATTQLRFTWINDNVTENLQLQLPANTSTIGTHIRYHLPATVHVESVNDDSSSAGANFDLHTVLIMNKRLRCQC